MASIFETLNGINVNEHTEKKKAGKDSHGRDIELTYLSWAWAWAEVKKAFPDATYTVYERPDGCIYWTDGRYCWVKTGLTINGLEHIEYLPVMDYRNQSIPLEKVTSTDVNKAIQRSLTKAAARHGLGLYIYAGEDLPEGEPEPETKAPEPKRNPAMDELQRFCAENGVDKVGMQRFRSIAVENGIIPGKGWQDYTMAEIKRLETFIVKNREA